MPESDRLNIKHYFDNLEIDNTYKHLIIPRYNNTISITDTYIDWNDFSNRHGPAICSVYNGLPFTLEQVIPGDLYPMMGIIDSAGKEIIIYQNLEGTPGLELRNSKILDLTEWKYHPCYNY